MSRIELNDNVMDIMCKMAEGNPGAMSVLAELLENTEKIDPQNFLGCLGSIVMLDSYGIYGTDIYVLYSDICNRNIIHMIATIRAAQLGIINSELLADACHRQDYSGKDLIDVEDIYNKVKEQLENFDKE